MSESIPAAKRSDPQDRSPMLQAVEAATGHRPDCSVIWLHGLGADGHDFEPVVPQLGSVSGGGVRFVFPHAPIRPVTLNGGMPMRAWYDIRAIDASRDQDEAGIQSSTAHVHALIEREVERGVTASRIVLAGFSQGGAMALHVALRYPESLAGVVALSAYLLFPDRLAAELSEANRGLPVFLGHGTLDPMVPHAMGERTRDLLQAASLPVTWRSYPIPHSVSGQEIEDLGSWLRGRLG